MSISYPAVDHIVDAIVFQPLFIPGGTKPVFVPFIVAGGQALPRGSVMGRVTSTNKLILSLSAASDGSQVPIGITVEELATYMNDGVTALDMSVAICVGGHVNVAALNFGTGQTWLNTQAALQNAGITGRYMGYSG